MTNKVVLIAGPTASGKSAVGLKLAQSVGGAVINADSMQVYRELRILTARPSLEEEALAPHRLYGHIAAEAPYSAGQFTREAEAEIRRCRSEGLVPIFAGGTGLYLRTLITPMAAIPDIPDDIRADVRIRMQLEGPMTLHAELKDIDPVFAAKVGMNDPQRIARGIEVYEATGKSMTHWHNTPPLPPIIDPADLVRVVLWPDRDVLRDRIGTRFDAMIEAGALEEAKAYQALGLSSDLPATRAHGLRGLMKVLDGDLTLEDAIEGAVNETRQYAKRQFTWFRNQFEDWPRIDPDAEDAAAAIELSLGAR